MDKKIKSAKSKMDKSMNKLLKADKKNDMKMEKCEKKMSHKKK